MDPVGYKRWDIRFIVPSEGAMKEQELKKYGFIWQHYVKCEKRKLRIFKAIFLISSFVSSVFNRLDGDSKFNHALSLLHTPNLYVFFIL